MTAARYPTLLRRLHWLTAAIFVWQFASRPLATSADVDPALAYHLQGLHTLGGLLIFGCAAARLVMRSRYPQPEATRLGPPAQRVAAVVVHGALYTIMLGQPVLGFLAVRDGRFAELHVGLAWFALALIALHACAALWHRIVRRDGVFGRMRW